jgi:pilus assembly protein Flp/PilA
MQIGTVQDLRRPVWARSSAQGMVEYGLIIALVAIVAIAGLIILGPKLSEIFSSLGSSI